MHKNPKFSVIIPVYNAGRYLSHCLETVVAQTLKDIEIICINDGSTDQSPDILRQYQALDGRIHVISQANGGLPSARNAGLRAAGGDCILFLDADDYLSERACDRLYNEFIQTNADIVVFGTTVFPWHIARGQVWLNNKLRVATKYYARNTKMALFLENASNPFVWNKCYKRKFLENHGFRFDEELLYGEDTPFLFCTFPAAREISFIEDKLYNYRCSSQGSLMAQAGKNPKRKLEWHLKMAEKILTDWREKSYLEDAVDEMYLWLLEFFVYDLEKGDIAREDRQEIAGEVIGLIERFDLRFGRKKKGKDGERLRRRLYAVAKRKE